MAGTKEGAQKGVATKRERNFDFAGAGSTGGKKKVKKGLATLTKRQRRAIAKKGGKARHKAT